MAAQNPEVVKAKPAAMSLVVAVKRVAVVASKTTRIGLN
jgi:hypothetical protein